MTAQQCTCSPDDTCLGVDCSATACQNYPFRNCVADTSEHWTPELDPADFIR